MITLDEQKFEPTIIGFYCPWCGVNSTIEGKLARSKNFKAIPVPCTGRVDSFHILKAFQEGVDGIIVAGCSKDVGCHHNYGNVKAERRVNALKKKLETIGLGKGRLEMYFLSAENPNKLVEYLTEFTEKIKRLGPNPLGKRWQTTRLE